MKKKRLISLVSILLLAIVLVLLLILNTNKKEFDEDKAMVTLKNDYKIMNSIYGEDNGDYIVVNDSKYYLIKDFKSLDELSKAINKTYVKIKAIELGNFIAEDNVVIELKNKLYINRKEQCNINNFNNKIDNYEKGKNNYFILHNGIGINVFEEENSYKLFSSFYEC